MMRNFQAILTTIFIAALLLSCSGSTHPVSPDNSFAPGVIVEPQSGPGIPNDTSFLWGYYDVRFDFDTKTVQVSPNRSVEYYVNVVKFLNGSPPGISFAFNGVTPGTGYVDVDLDVTITHPIDMEAYNGYDVRGIFIGNGSAIMDYGPQVALAKKSQDQILMNADGYTRWFNPTEFTTPKVWGYIPGDFAPPAYIGTATVNPYKYFGEGLGSVDDLWTYLTSGGTDVGYFLHGSSNTRNYLIRFPVPTPGTKYNYAVMANWAGTAPSMHPAHAEEAMGLEVVDNSTLWYVDPSNNGGSLVLDITVFDWFSELTGGVMDDYNIIVTTNVLSNFYTLDTTEMTPVGSGDHWFTFHTEIPCDNVQQVDGNELIVIVEYPGSDYKNPAGVQNAAWDEPLAAFFRYDLSVSPVAPASIVVLTPNGGEHWDAGSTQDITWTSEYLTGTVFIEYSSDDFTYDINSIATDEVDDGTYQWTDIPCEISTALKIRVSSTDNPSVNDMSDANFSIPQGGWAQSWGMTDDDHSQDVAVDQYGNSYITGTTTGATTDYDCVLLKYDPCGNLVWERIWGGGYSDVPHGVATDMAGNVYITGYFDNDADFDPGPGDEHRTSNGGYDVFILKLDSHGNFMWADTFGGSNDDYAYGIAADLAGNVFVTGAFFDTVDFDPGPGTDERTAVGSEDIYVCKFDTEGAFVNVAAWGGSSYDNGLDVYTDLIGNVTVSGYYQTTADFDPGTGTENHTSAGGHDAFLSFFNSDLDWQWSATWGGISNDHCNATAVDFQGNVYGTGAFQDTVDFNPDAGTDNHTSAGGYDSFLSVFNVSGTWQWTVTWGGTDSNSAYGIAISPLGDIFVTGAFRGTADFDPGVGNYPVVSNGNADVFLLKLNSTGDLQWAFSWGDSVYNEGVGVVIDPARNIFVATSQFMDPTDFAPTDPMCGNSPDIHNSNGNMDFALTKFLPDGCW